MQRHSVVTLALTALLAAAGALSLPSAGGAQPARDHTTIEVSNDGVTVVFMAQSAHNLLSLTVRIAGPDGALVFDRRVEDSMVEWIPEGELAEGALYQWEARAVTAAPGAQPSTQHSGHDDLSRQQDKTGFSMRPGLKGPGSPPVEALYAETDKRVDQASGMLRVEEGLLVGPDSPMQSAVPAERMLGSLLEWLVGSAHAGTHVEDWLIVQDTSNFGRTELNVVSDDQRSWSMVNVDGNFYIEESDSDLNFGTERLTIKPGGNLGLGTTQPQDILHIRHPEPVIRFNDSDNEQTWQLMASQFGYRLADQTAGTLPFYIQPGAPSDAFRISAGGDIGLGTATPTFPLHIADTLPGIRYEDTNDAHSWLSYVTSRDYVIRDITNGTSPVRIMDATPTGMLTTGPFGALLGSLYVGNQGTEAGNVGIGTFSPANPLHVWSGDGSAKILVEEASSTTQARELFELRNNGGPFFIFRNTDIGESYSFAMGATGHFLISHQQSAGVQFRLTPNGDAQFQGDVTANGVLLTSSRETKTDFAPVDAKSLLDKLDGLDVSAWRYKREPATERHIGPMAEDFREVFGIGDGQHISAGDANGILFAAVKALKAKDDELSKAVAEMDRLEARLMALEARLATD